MTIFWNVVFVVWCVVLVGVGLVGAVLWQGGEGEANGASFFGRVFVYAAAALLAVSIALKAIL